MPRERHTEAKRPNTEALSEIVDSLEDEIVCKALCRCVDLSENLPRWALVLLGRNALHIVTGEETAMLGRLVGQSRIEHHLLSLPLRQISSITPPPRRSALGRLMRGPVEAIRIECMDGTVLVMEIDRKEILIQKLVDSVEPGAVDTS
jgi:hypothetical protein